MRFNAPLPFLTGNVLKLTLTGLFQAQQVQSSLYYLNSAFAVSTLADVAAFGPAWETLFAARYFACFAGDYVSERLTVADVSLGVAPTYSYIWAGGTQSGTVAGVSLDSILAAVHSFSSIKKGQHGRGRMYMGPIPVAFTTAATDPDVLNATALTAYNAFTAGIVGTTVPVSGTNYHLCLATRPTQPATLITQAINVSGAHTDTVIGTVRRRRAGRGQ